VKKLKEFDRKDYSASFERNIRNCSRAIIINENKYAMLFSNKYKDYCFPGGGNESGETLEETLIREVREETGLIIIPQSIVEYGMTTEIRKDVFVDNIIYEKRDYYYICEVEKEIHQRKLTKGEIESQYILEYVSLDYAINTNENESLIEQKYLEPEIYVMKLLLNGCK